MPSRVMSLLWSFSGILVVGFPGRSHDIFSLKFLAILSESGLASISLSGFYIQLKSAWLLT